MTTALASASIPASTSVKTPQLSLAAAQAQFGGGHGYLAACTMGLPTRDTIQAQHADLDRAYHTGTDCAVYEAAVAAGRASYARLVGVSTDRVAIGSQESVMAGVIAASAPDGAEIVCIDGDFSSIIFPFLQQQHRGVHVRHVPQDAVAESVTERTWLVAFSLVQSATGVIADADTIIAAAARTGTRTLCDLTQAAGWLPVDASKFDATIGHAYKWLSAPRGVAFMTVSQDFAGRLRPVQAGWYAGDDPWTSTYGPNMHLADDARRFDVSPAWQSWIGAAPALDMYASLDMQEVAAYDIALGDALCEGLGLTTRGQSIVTWHDPDGDQLARLTGAGIVASGRAGNARVAFHLWNDESDVDAVLRALGR
ncbi:aminotransferase class V-fold PLP-dependent enzyme [Rathayibacter soli]|uniref:aminotransferase class V-fold PLP-dependent enzyme n=1 Tax=Rathayibacter soli TaxID=3144168 RepID=UPI0027E4AD87|nr:aminotransferase class V-fold PLP-dependent enzyme [Glaciibacter superstes]